ncbi:MAG: DUF3800 domain-containing protein [Chloroflexota bacterium]|nr:DUF3800 domain-containing protein [Chloroflexota bacterium]
MLVFVDESGDPGLKLEQGSSTHFVVALVIFEDHDETGLRYIKSLKEMLGSSARADIAVGYFFISGFEQARSV